MKKIYTTLLIMAFAAINSFSQTFPLAHDLASGPYTFTQWDTANPALTYPANTIFHVVKTKDAPETEPASGDWACGYQLTAGCYIGARGFEGISFKNVNASQNSVCLANNINPNDTNVYVGDLTISINTINCANININWLGRMLSNFTYSFPNPATSRFYGIACQFRIGDTGVFTNMPANYLFKCNSDTNVYKPLGQADTMVSVLPASCENQALVQVRWIYHQLPEGHGGPRPVLGLDDINVTATTVITSTRDEEQVNSLKIYPNPIGQGKLLFNKSVNFVVYDVLGQAISSPTLSKEFNVDNLQRGVYFVKSSLGETVRFIKQ